MSSERAVDRAAADAAPRARRVGVKTLAALVVYGASIAATIALGLLALTRTWAFERTLFCIRASGWCALAALLLALCASPTGKLVAFVRRRSVEGTVAPIRRALGISAAAFATVHGALGLATYLASSLHHVFDLVWVRAGLVAWAVLFVLWLTSYPRLVRALRIRVWKPLHRAAYAAALFTLQHTLLAPLAPRAWILGAFGVALAIGLLRALPQRSASASHSRSQAQS